MFLNGFVEGAKIVREQFPEVKCLLPHGDPAFVVHFLQRQSTEVAPAARRRLRRHSVLRAAARAAVPPGVAAPAVHDAQGDDRRGHHEAAAADVRRPVRAERPGRADRSGAGRPDDSQQPDPDGLRHRHSERRLPGLRHGQLLGRAALRLRRAESRLARNAEARLHGAGHADAAPEPRQLRQVGSDRQPEHVCLAVQALQDRQAGARDVDAARQAAGDDRRARRARRSPCSTRTTTRWSWPAKDGKVTFTRRPVAVLRRRADGRRRRSRSASRTTPTRKPGEHGARSSPTSATARGRSPCRQEAEYEESHLPYIYRYPEQDDGRSRSTRRRRKAARRWRCTSRQPEKDRVFVPYYSVLKPAKPIEIPGKASAPRPVGEGARRLGPRGLLRSRRQGRAVDQRRHARRVELRRPAQLDELQLRRLALPADGTAGQQPATTSSASRATPGGARTAAATATSICR